MNSISQWLTNIWQIESDFQHEIAQYTLTDIEIFRNRAIKDSLENLQLKNEISRLEDNLTEKSSDLDSVKQENELLIARQSIESLGLWYSFRSGYTTVYDNSYEKTHLHPGLYPFSGIISLSLKSKFSIIFESTYYYSTKSHDNAIKKDSPSNKLPSLEGYTFGIGVDLPNPIKIIKSIGVSVGRQSFYENGKQSFFDINSAWMVRGNLKLRLFQRKYANVSLYLGSSYFAYTLEREMSFVLPEISVQISYKHPK